MACRSQGREDDRFEFGVSPRSDRLADRARADRPGQILHPPAAKADQLEPKQKFLQDLNRATNSVEFPRAVFHENEVFLSLCPSGTIDRQRTKRRWSS